VLPLGLQGRRPARIDHHNHRITKLISLIDAVLGSSVPAVLVVIAHPMLGVHDSSVTLVAPSVCRTDATVLDSHLIMRWHNVPVESLSC
jgi:hypothetical protein